MKIYIDNGYNPRNDEAAGVLYETGLRMADSLREYGMEVMLSVPENTLKAAEGQNQAVLHINQANEWGADLFLALNLNYSPDRYATGAAAGVFKPSPETEAVSASALDLLSTQTHLQNRGITQRQDCLPLKKAKMPAMVLDIGFLTNKNDFELATKHPELISQLVAKGVAEGLRDIRETPATADAENPVLKTRPAFFQLYPAGRKNICRFTVNVLSSVIPRKPVANAHVTVYHGKEGKHILIYRGETRNDGSTIPVELPYFSDKAPNCPEMFCICVRHQDYMPKNTWIYINSERIKRENIFLDERRISNR